MLSGGAFPDPAAFLRLPPPPGSGRRGHQGRPGRVHQYNVWGSPYGTSPGTPVPVDFDWPYAESSQLRDILADPVSILTRGSATYLENIDDANVVAKAMLAMAILRAFYYIWYIRTSGVSRTFRYKNMGDEYYLLESLVIARRVLDNLLTRIRAGDINLRGIFDVGKLDKLVEGLDRNRLYPQSRHHGDPWQNHAIDNMENEIARGNIEYRPSYDNLSTHFGEVMRRFYNAEFVARPLPDPLADGVNFAPGPVAQPTFLLDPQATIRERRTPIRNYNIPEYAYSRFPVHYLTQ